MPLAFREAEVSTVLVGKERRPVRLCILDLRKAVYKKSQG